MIFLKNVKNIIFSLDDDVKPVRDEVDDVIKILVATDIHCGYGENKPNMYVVKFWI